MILGLLDGMDGHVPRQADTGWSCMRHARRRTKSGDGMGVHAPRWTQSQGRLIASVQNAAKREVLVALHKAPTAGDDEGDQTRWGNGMQNAWLVALHKALTAGAGCTTPSAEVAALLQALMGGAGGLA